MRILQTMISGISLILGLGIRMSDPYVCVLSWALLGTRNPSSRPQQATPDAPMGAPCFTCCRHPLSCACKNTKGPKYPFRVSASIIIMVLGRCIRVLRPNTRGNSGNHGLQSFIYYIPYILYYKLYTVHFICNALLDPYIFD